MIDELKSELHAIEEYKQTNQASENNNRSLSLERTGKKDSAQKNGL